MSKKNGRPTPFYDTKGYGPAVAQIDDGMKTTGHLVSLMLERAKIEKLYADKLDSWSKAMKTKLGKMKEHEKSQVVWVEVISEANCTAATHRALYADINTNCVDATKAWKDQIWKKKFMGGTVQKEQHDKKFQEVQKHWNALLNKAKKCKSSYDKAMKTVATQKQTTDNLSTHTDENDPKLMASRSTLTQKTQDCQTTKSDYESAINELGQVKDQYIRDMNDAFNDVVNFEQERLEFTSKMMVTYHQACKHKIQADLSFDIPPKTKEEEPTTVNVLQKMKIIEQVVNSQDISGPIADFKREKGPGNAAEMDWPAFEDYDPNAIAQEAKFNKKNNGQSVARNDTEGTIKSIPEPQSYNQGFSQEEPQAPPPVYNEPAWDSTPETFEPPVMTNGGGEEQYVTVTFPYEAQEEDELTIDEGEQILKLTDPDSEGWCRGRKTDGTEGMFPADYVDLTGSSES